jgi:hypothetical protein
MSEAFPAWEDIVPDPRARQLLIKGVLGQSPRQRIPEGRRPDASGCDAEPSDAQPSRVAGRELYLIYEAADGDETERTITIRHIAERPDGRHLIHAFCHERKAPRAFRADRVVECFDPVTGEEIDFPDLLAGMMRRAWQVDRADLEDFVRVLVFMAYCDGRVALEEVGAIDDWIARFVLRMDGTDADFDQAQRFARVAAIEGIDFLMALRRLTTAHNATQLCRLTIQAVQDVMEADFEVADAELGWHAVVVRTIKQAAML